MSRPCSHRALVEARHDGRLAGRDVGPIDRHVRGCDPCATYAADLARTKEALHDALAPEPLPLEHHRARALLLRAAGQPAETAPRRLRAWHGAAAALALAAATVGVVWSTADHEQPAAVSSRREVTTITGSAGAVFHRVVEGSTDSIDLVEGKVEARVRILGPGERFLVRTRDAEVEVRGTIFTVEALHGTIVGVDVREGKVEVRSHGATSLVVAGNSWKASPVPAEAASEIEAPAQVHASATGSAAASAPVPSLLVASSPLRDETSPPAPVTSHPSPRASSAPAVTLALSGSAPAPGRKPAPADGAGSLREAMRDLERGDYGRAAERLEAARVEEERDPERVELAEYLKAVALQRAGRDEDAATAARAYLVKHPHGRFVGEATRMADRRP